MDDEGHGNGNGEFDKDDELLGEMTELDGGIYRMKELRYGNYFVREKTAPTGFVLDEKVYTVSIEENGKTYVVENEAGKGFMNAAQTGSLKIVKTSSDGKLEGFSFRVTGTDYDKTFKTDKNGEIFIEDLRIGEYTVSEVSDKASLYPKDFRRAEREKAQRIRTIRRIEKMAVNQKAVKVLNKVFEAGFTDEKAISAMTMDDILSMQGITVADIGLINDLQKSIKANKVISFLGGGTNE